MRQRLSSVLVVVAIAVVFLIVAVAAVRSFFSMRPGITLIARDRLARVESGNRDLDLSFALLGSPQGIATNGRDLLIGNRSDPWGAMRLFRNGGTFSARKEPIIEKRFQQKINLSAITWNGTNYVGLTTASWFNQGAEGDVFTVLDPTTLDVLSIRPAPKLLGCLAWDGTQYWAATRNHTADSPEPALLYRLDRSFNVLGTSAAPGVGCQGLAWDGRYLWIADVFDDSIRVLDVSGAEPHVVHRAFMNLEYLSGIVAYEGEMWITEYEHHQLHRVRPSSRMAWLRGTKTEVVAASAIAPATETVLFTKQTNEFAKRPQDDTELLDWSAALRDGNVVGEWRIWFGHDLFVQPQFARYEITVILPDGGSVKKELQASPGENVMRDVVLAPAIASGEYRVEVFMTAQYVKPDGQAQILNHWGGRLDLRK